MSHSTPPVYNNSNVTATGEPPLDQPYVGAPLPVVFKRFFKKYATFSGRASRSEFWWYELVAVVVGVVYLGLSTALAHSSALVAVEVIYYIWAAATLIPSLALSWRRLHDTNRAGGWYFIGLIPIVGGILFLVWMAGESKPAGARFDR